MFSKNILLFIQLRFIIHSLGVQILYFRPSPYNIWKPNNFCLDINQRKKYFCKIKTGPLNLKFHKTEARPIWHCPLTRFKIVAQTRGSCFHYWGDNYTNRFYFRSHIRSTKSVNALKAAIGCYIEFIKSSQTFRNGSMSAVTGWDASFSNK